ncbi:MAG: sulfotransferase domain-containing protein [Gammaproteobacteria bacterium]|nr:sulfotransferase domain-containing protein [Gammaproteobacteria bacterium]
MLDFLLVLLVAYFAYLGTMMLYFELKTRGDNYFSLPLAERRNLRAKIQKHARFIYPFFALVSKAFRLRKFPVIRYRGVTGPLMMSSKKSYKFTYNYQPQSNDIFIATQMKCGTTWMQQIVFEVLHRGKGDLSDEGYRHMYALSPWIETTPTSSVPFERAKLVGEKNSRIIKTHMPASLCPHSDKAKYIYVTRHPVSCFASCFDFFHLLVGPLAPDRDEMIKWFCSEDMLWGSWPTHVEGWWRRAEEHNNVLFVHYESMKKDLPGAVRKVADFLEMDLSAEEIDQVVHRSSFEYMKEHEEHFSMFSPNIFSESLKSVRFMQAGTLERYKDVSDTGSQFIMDFCRERLKGGHYPLETFYPDSKSLPVHDDQVERVEMSNVL